MYLALMNFWKPEEHDVSLGELSSLVKREYTNRHTLLSGLNFKTLKNSKVHFQKHKDDNLDIHKYNKHGSTTYNKY
jgi:hypothetical protein